jgi:hypothetical protein
MFSPASEKYFGEKQAVPQSLRDIINYLTSVQKVI